MRKLTSPNHTPERGEIYWLRVTAFGPGSTLSLNGENPVTVDSLSAYVCPKDKPWKMFDMAGVLSVEFSGDPREPFPGPVATGQGTSGNPVVGTGPAATPTVAQPAAATQATATKAAGASGIKHVCKGVSVNLEAVAAQGDIIFNLRDGVSGAGAVLWSIRLALGVGQSFADFFALPDVTGSAATAMTLETATAPAGTNFASVTLFTYDSQ